VSSAVSGTTGEGRRAWTSDGAPRSAKTLVIGIGNPDRGDDAIGVRVVQALLARWNAQARSGVDVRVMRGDAFALLDAWQGYGRVLLVDATAPAGTPGTVRRLRGGDGVRESSSPSSHGWSVAEAIALGEALGALPTRIDVVGVEAQRFGHGEGLTGAVEASIDAAVDALEAVLAEPW